VWAVAVAGELPVTDSREYIIASRLTLPITGDCQVKLYPINDELSRVAAQSRIYPGDVHALGIVGNSALMDWASGVNRSLPLGCRETSSPQGGSLAVLVPPTGNGVLNQIPAGDGRESSSEQVVPGDGAPLHRAVS